MKTLRLSFRALLGLGLLLSLLAAPAGGMNAVVAQSNTTPATPLTYSPSVGTVTNLPTYVWQRISGATSYVLSVYDSSNGLKVVDISVNSTHCSTTVNRCAYKPTTMLIYNRTYNWTIKAKTGSVSSPASPRRSFIPQTGFNSTFSGAHSNWSAYSVGRWYDTSTYIYTYGKSGLWSSIGYFGTFANYSYEVRMKMSYPSVSPFGLIVRGTPVLTYNDDWKNGYHFMLYKNSFAIWKTVSSSKVYLRGWTASSHILTNNWNTLKVVADGKYFRFYINGHFVWQGTDTSFTTGRVGVIMYRSTTSEKFMVDWATLSKATYYTTSAVRENMGLAPTNP